MAVAKKMGPSNPKKGQMYTGKQSSKSTSTVPFGGVVKNDKASNVDRGNQRKVRANKSVGK